MHHRAISGFEITMIGRKSISTWVLPVFGVAALFFALSVGQARAASLGSFSLSGNAIVVSGGTGPNNSAVDLTSNLGDATYSDVDFTPSGSLTVADITTLSADYNVGGSDCGGGSPRFSISLSSGKNIFVYFGPTPNFTGCFYGWQNTGNVTQAADSRVDTTQLGGPFYGTWANAVTLAGSTSISSISVVLDGGWTTARGQDVTIDNFNVNGSVMNGANLK